MLDAHSNSEGACAVVTCIESRAAANEACATIPPIAAHRKYIALASVF